MLQLASGSSPFQSGDGDKVLVTGGAGFIGSHTVEALLRRGYRVTVLDDFSSGTRKNLPGSHPRLRVVEGDVRDHDLLTRELSGVSGCIHLAAQVSVANSWADPVQSCEININGFVNLISAMAVQEVPRCVFASSAAVYGTPTELPIKEHAKQAPIAPYGLEKLTMERYARLFSPHTGTQFTALRYFNVFGPRQDPSSPYSGVITKFSQRLQAGLPVTIFGTGKQTRDFVFVEDIAEANVCALEAGVEGAFNVSTGKFVSLLQLTEAMGRALGVKPVIEFDAEQAGDIRDSCGDNTKIIHRLGFAPAWNLDEGLGLLLAPHVKAA